MVNQTTGIDWKDVDLVLSTNDPYENSKEPILEEWYLNYNNYPQAKNYNGRVIPSFDYSGQRLRGEVIDASTGEPLPFAKISFYNNPNVTAVTDFDGKFEVIVPKGEQYVMASFVGYDQVSLAITAPYLKFFVQPQDLNLNEITVSGSGSAARPATLNVNSQGYANTTLESVTVKKSRLFSRKDKSMEESAAADFDGITEQYAFMVGTEVVQKDLRVEYAIQSKFTIPSDGQDQRVTISNYTLPANYEYHTVPKLDPSVYLVAQVSGWEKLNLLNGESNLYFDGTYIGKSYIDVNSTKDTLTFSLGKDNKIQVERKKVTEKSKSKAIGSRQRVDVAWEIKLKNNGGAKIPILVKDQFPISNVDDIKVKRGDFPEGKEAENSGIITWSFVLDPSQSKILKFDYTVDFQKGYVLYIE